MIFAVISGFLVVGIGIFYIYYSKRIYHYNLESYELQLRHFADTPIYGPFIKFNASIYRSQFSPRLYWLIGGAIIALGLFLIISSLVLEFGPPPS